MEPPEEEFTLATVTIVKTFAEDGDVYTWSEASTPDGDDVALIDILGMLELAKDTFIRQAMGEDED